MEYVVKPNMVIGRLSYAVYKGGEIVAEFAEEVKARMYADSHTVPRSWLIYECNSCLWWRNDAMGYSAKIADAGLFTKGVADTHAGSKDRRDRVFHIADQRREIERALAVAEEDVAKLGKLKEILDGCR